jgi:hypothetical protein
VATLQSLLERNELGRGESSHWPTPLARVKVGHIMKTSTSSGRYSGEGVSALVLSACLLVLPRSASASLGRDEASVQVDLAQMRGDGHVVKAADHTVHEIRVPGGTVIKEYVSPGGTVFGISWQGPFRPDLRQLLGDYFDEFQEASRAAKRRGAGRGPLSMDTPELVVHLGGHPRAFFGRAYVPGLLPPGVAAKDIK